MNLKTLTLAAVVAALCAPAVAAHGSGPDVTVTVDPGVNCQTQRVDTDDLLPPSVESRADAWTEDCDAGASYDGVVYHAHCAEASTKGQPTYSGPDVSVGETCDVLVEA